MPAKRQAMNINNCMFCEMESEEGDPLHQVLTFDADVNIRDMVTELKDKKLLAQMKFNHKGGKISLEVPC